MVTRRKQHSSQRPVQQGPAVTASRPNKIGASTPYHFRGRKPTPYGGLLPPPRPGDRTAGEGAPAQAERPAAAVGTGTDLPYGRPN